MSQSNPYASPGAELSHSATGKFEITGPKAVGVGRGWDWITDAFGYFKKNPGPWILTLIVGLLVFVLMNIVPILGQIALMTTYYVWLAGIMLGCHEQDRGGSFKVGHLFAGFNDPLKLVVLSLLVTVVGTFVMFVTVGPMYLELLEGGDPSPEAVEAMMDLTGFWLPFLFGMLAMIPVMMAVWFAPALIAINDVSIGTALRLSFFGCLKNVLPLTLYGIIAFVLYILGAIPLLLGLLIVLPTLMASMYTSYKDIFID